MIIPKQYLKPSSAPALARACSPNTATWRHGSGEPGFHPQQAGYRYIPGCCCRDNLRLRFEPRARAVGLLDFGIRCVISTSFATSSTIIASEGSWRSASPGRPRQTVRRRRAGRQRDADHRSPSRRSRPDGGMVNSRSIRSATLPAQRSRRHRTDHGKEGLDRRVRGKGQDRARLGLISRFKPVGGRMRPDVVTFWHGRSMRSA